MSRITRVHRRILGLTLIVLGAIAAACGGSGDTEPGQVHVLTWDGIVNPVMERYIDRGIGDAEDADAAAIVLRLDTPGGLDSSMRDIIQRMQANGYQIADVIEARATAAVLLRLPSSSESDSSP